MTRIHSVLDLGAILARPGYKVREQFGAESVDTAKPPASKYHNEKTNGYASAKEARRAVELQILERAGKVRNLREQVPYLLIPPAKDDEGKSIERACSYIADFTYDELVDGQWCPVVLDVKGLCTDVYIIKRKLMWFIYKIRVREE